MGTHYKKIDDFVLISKTNIKLKRRNIQKVKFH